MNVDLNVQLNIKSDSQLGMMICYLTCVINQSKNLLNIDVSVFQNAANILLLSMVQLIETMKLQEAIDMFNKEIDSIQLEKNNMLEAYKQLLYATYVPPP